MVKEPNTIELPLLKLIVALIETIGVAIPSYATHQKAVLHLSYSLGKASQLDDHHLHQLTLAALFQHIGVFSSQEFKKIMDYAKKSEDVINKSDDHIAKGLLLIRGVPMFHDVADIIDGCYHHDFQSNNTQSADSLLLASQILHLSNEIALQINPNREILSQSPEIVDWILKGPYSFHPKAISALEKVKNIEAFWIELEILDCSFLRRINGHDYTVTIESFEKIAFFLAQITDFRSPFTSTHSSGVAAVSEYIAKIMGLGETHCRRVKVAGLLHDIWRLSIPNSILEKPGGLTPEERFMINKHTFYTWKILEPFTSLSEIKVWASSHHEYLDGSGYPYHLDKESLPTESRIMVVADILTALTEDRPYRKNVMKSEKVKAILIEEAENNKLDQDIVQIVLDHYQDLTNYRENAQKQVSEVFQTFSKMVTQEMYVTWGQYQNDMNQYKYDLRFEDVQYILKESNSLFFSASDSLYPNLKRYYCWGTLSHLETQNEVIIEMFLINNAIKIVKASLDTVYSTTNLINFLGTQKNISLFSKRQVVVLHKQFSQDYPSTFFKEEELVHFQELFSIALRKMSEKLSQMIRKEVLTEKAKLDLVEKAMFSEKVGGTDENLVCIGLRYSGIHLRDYDLPVHYGLILFTFSEKDIFPISESLLAELDMSDDVLYLKLFESTLNELGNLFANELLTLFSSVSGYRILPSIPVLIQGSAEKIKEPLEQLLVKADKEGFMVKARFNFDDHVTRGKFFLFPDDLNIVKGII